MSYSHFMYHPAAMQKQLDKSVHMFTQEFRFTPAVIAKSRMHTLQNARIGLHHWMLEYFSLGLVL